MYTRRQYFCVWFILLGYQIADAEFNPFSDSIPYTIKWGGPLEANELDREGLISMPLMTHNNEKYECLYRDDFESAENDHVDKESYDGPTPAQILQDFSKKTSCSYRVESYWTYELCHGKKFRQYHEDKNADEDIPKDNKQDYTLGNYAPEQAEQREDNTIQLEGDKYRYYEVFYDDGTLCDLTEIHRRITVQYICHESGRGDLYQIKETSTCEYTAIVLLAELCNHPDYKVSKETSRVISCHSIGSAPRKPKMQNEIDVQLAKRPPKAPKISGTTVRNAPSTPAGSDPAASRPAAPGITKEEQESTRTEIGSEEDRRFLLNFLSGDYCLQGGTGWWSFELCYGKTVKQFHVEGGKRVTNILLGTWNKQDHIKWLGNNPVKRPRAKSNRRYISQLYTEGDYCDEAAKQRKVEVKLKCSKTGSGSSHAVAIYLLEPSTCEYILTVESAVLCTIVSEADSDGLFTSDP